MPSSPLTAEGDLLRAFRAAVRAKIERDLEREIRDSEERKAKVLPSVRHAIAMARVQGLCGRAWLFGSFAWGTPGERSDVDVLLESCADPFAVASIVGRSAERDVHAISIDDAPPALRERATRDGLEL